MISSVDIGLIKNGSDFEQACSKDVRKAAIKIRSVVLSALENLPKEEIADLQHIIFEISEALED